jgi:hypothetical protein
MRAERPFSPCGGQARAGQHPRRRWNDLAMREDSCSACKKSGALGSAQAARDSVEPPNLAIKRLDLDIHSLRGDLSDRPSERASRATGARAQSSATSAFEASSQRPSRASRQPRIPQPKGRGVSVAARFPSSQPPVARPCVPARVGWNSTMTESATDPVDLFVRCLALFAALIDTEGTLVSTQAADSLRLCRCVGFLGRDTP